MQFQHSADIWHDYPALVPGVLYAEGITSDADVSPAVGRLTGIARSRLATVVTESELPQIWAWRRAFAQMGLKPTQYRCASEPFPGQSLDKPVDDSATQNPRRLFGAMLAYYRTRAGMTPGTAGRDGVPVGQPDPQSRSGQPVGHRGAGPGV